MRIIYRPGDIEPQPVIDRDSDEITVDDVMLVHSTINEEDIKRTFQNIDDWKRAAIELTMTNLYQAFGELSPHESLMVRGMMATNLQRLLNTLVIEWGLTVGQPVDMPGDGNRREQVRQERLG